MNYTISGKIDNNGNASFSTKETSYAFGIKMTQENLPNPVELLLGSFAACCLKNVERFSDILQFQYDSAEIEIIGERQETPTQVIGIQYLIKIKSSDPKLNTELLHKNLQKYGTIYNTLKSLIHIEGKIEIYSQIP